MERGLPSSRHNCLNGYCSPATDLFGSKVPLAIIEGSEMHTERVRTRTGV